MPASGFDCYLQDARNNFDAVRPAPIPTALSGQSQSIHVSTNCYYGFHGTKNTESTNISTDCDMMEVGDISTISSMQPTTTAKKRSAGDDIGVFPQTKRHRHEDVSSMCSLVGTRSSPSHSASAFNTKIFTILHTSFKSNLIKLLSLYNI